MHTEGCAFPSLFPCLSHVTSSFQTIVGRLFEGRRSAVIIRTLVAESNNFSDQCCELRCFVIRDYAVILRYGWITRAFPPARKNGDKRHKKWRKWETRPSVNSYDSLRHRSLRSPIKINVSVSGSVAVSVHMESCTIHLYFLEFHRICTNGSAL